MVNSKGLIGNISLKAKRIYEGCKHDRYVHTSSFLRPFNIMFVQRRNVPSSGLSDSPLKMDQRTRYWVRFHKHPRQFFIILLSNDRLGRIYFHLTKDPTPKASFSLYLDWLLRGVEILNDADHVSDCYHLYTRLLEVIHRFKFVHDLPWDSSFTEEWVVWVWTWW